MLSIFPNRDFVNVLFAFSRNLSLPSQSRVKKTHLNLLCAVFLTFCTKTSFRKIHSCTVTFPWASSLSLSMSETFNLSIDPFNVLVRIHFTHKSVTLRLPTMTGLFLLDSASKTNYFRPPLSGSESCGKCCLKKKRLFNRCVFGSSHEKSMRRPTLLHPYLLVRRVPETYTEPSARSRGFEIFRET